MLVPAAVRPGLQLEEILVVALTVMGLTNCVQLTTPVLSNLPSRRPRRYLLLLLELLLTTTVVLDLVVEVAQRGQAEITVGGVTELLLLVALMVLELVLPGEARS